MNGADSKRLRMTADVAPTFFSVCAQQVLSPKFENARNADSARDSCNDLAARSNGLRRSVDAHGPLVGCSASPLVESRTSANCTVVTREVAVVPLASRHAGALSARGRCAGAVELSDAAGQDHRAFGTG